MSSCRCRFIRLTTNLGNEMQIWFVLDNTKENESFATIQLAPDTVDQGYTECPNCETQSHSVHWLREAIIREKKDFLWNHFIKWWPPPRPPFMKSLFIFFPTIFWSKKKMILKVVWRVLMGVLRALHSVWSVFEGWKKNRGMKSVRPPPPCLQNYFTKKTSCTSLPQYHHLP